VVFISFGLFAPFNATVLASLLVTRRQFRERSFQSWRCTGLNGSGSDLQGSVAPDPRACRHTDAEREWSYARTSSIGKLDKALDDARANGWTVMDMKKDWKRIFAFDK
jgi:hypothetical protein